MATDAQQKHISFAQDSSVSENDVPENKKLQSSSNKPPLPKTIVPAAGNTKTTPAPAAIAPSGQVIPLPSTLQEALKTTLRRYFASLGENALEKDLHLYDVIIQEVERTLITQALEVTNGSQVKTARILGINRNTLRKKINFYKI